MVASRSVTGSYRSSRVMSHVWLKLYTLSWSLWSHYFASPGISFDFLFGFLSDPSVVLPLLSSIGATPIKYTIFKGENEHYLVTIKITWEYILTYCIYHIYQLKFCKIIINQAITVPQSVLKSIHELTSTMAFGATLKNHKNPILIGISSKISTQHKNMYTYQKNYKNREFSFSRF